MKKRKKTVLLLVAISLLMGLAALAILIGSPGKTETIQEAMRDAVLHDEKQISFFGLMSVNPGLISGFVLTGLLLFGALLIRLFAIPRFKNVPGNFQLLLEEAVGYFDNLAKTNSPHRHGFLGAYLFGAGVYIFIGTLFELLGLPWVGEGGISVTLPAPLSDINAAIALGFLSFGVIMSGGIASNGLRGVGLTLKDFSLPISMSFRLFGALLSGLLVTELVYFTLYQSFVIPVLVAIMFTLLHAVIQTYVLTMLTSIFYGEVSEPHHKKQKTIQKERGIQNAA